MHIRSSVKSLLPGTVVEIRRVIEIGATGAEMVANLRHSGSAPLPPRDEIDGQNRRFNSADGLGAAIYQQRMRSRLPEFARFIFRTPLASFSRQRGPIKDSAEAGQFDRRLGFPLLQRIPSGSEHEVEPIHDFRIDSPGRLP